MSGAQRLALINPIMGSAIEDGARDSLSGSGDLDVFYYNYDSGTKDTVLDRIRTERQYDID